MVSPKEFPFSKGKRYLLAELRGFAESISFLRRQDPTFSASLRSQSRALVWAKPWNEEFWSLKLFADCKQLEDDSQFCWTPDGAADFEIYTRRQTFRIQCTMAYPEVNTPNIKNGGHLHSREMERLNKQGYFFGGGGISKPTVRDHLDDLASWRSGITKALDNKLQLRCNGCHLLIFARGCWFNTLDNDFRDVVIPAIQSVPVSVWGPVYDYIAVVDEGPSAFVEVGRAEQAPMHMFDNANF